jgi:hypothetical protein
MATSNKARMAEQKRVNKIDAMRDELNALLDMPIGEWSSKQADTVEVLADLLGYTEDDKFWHSL